MESIMKDYEDIPGSDGMKVLRNAMNSETGKNSNVVIRNITENFWKKVIDATKRSRVCAVGTPGIGKTTSTCILIRLLLQQQKKRSFTMFEPRKKLASSICLHPHQKNL